MELVMLGMAVAAVVIAILWWWRRRAPAPVDDWPTSSTAETGSGSAPPPQVLDREALVNRSRVLDPSNWDNTAEAAGAGDDEPPETGDLPRFFDRDYLRRQRGDEPGNPG